MLRLHLPYMWTFSQSGSVVEYEFLSIGRYTKDKIFTESKISCISLFLFLSVGLLHLQDAPLIIETNE